MSLTKLFKATLSAAAVFAVAGTAMTVHAEEWKFAIEESTGDVQDLYAQKFKELVEEKSGGDVDVTIYTYGQLGTENDITELTASGAIQFSNASPGHLGTFVPEIQVFGVPYLLSQNNDVNKEILSQSPTIYKGLSKDFESKGLKLYTMYPEGEMVWTTKKKVETPKDFDGVKFRVMTSPILIDSYKSFGADPVALPWGEVYSGLQTSVIDAQVNPIFFIESAKFYEVTDYLIYAGQQQYTTTVVTNDAFYKGLSDERKELLKDVKSELDDYIFKAQADLNEKALDKIKKAKPSIKVIKLDADQRAKFEAASKSVGDNLVKEVGGDTKQVLGDLRDEIAKKEEEMGKM
ncbi:MULTISPECIES: DctP family TRAP transporter solute-binding subunit [unclassified Thalassospira]|uniref:TRAP transporter substrate-binding protein n=1 Tax=unclassified Thalassospira TaxID=2648997 RepID=UPI000A1F63DB|nr:DctP family TRAP transporter solute-binding subunit [Thalassospira sp. MCCC 1A01428]OSQ41169.1 C4-dicarboxylate ABC transporter [Thalassospira sp. MCCC 1A01428]